MLGLKLIHLCKPAEPQSTGGRLKEVQKAMQEGMGQAGGRERRGAGRWG